MSESNTEPKAQTRRTLVGRVVSDSMEKTRTVLVERRRSEEHTSELQSH